MLCNFSVKRNSVTPPLQSSLVGDNVQFVCKSDKPVKWYFEDGDLFSNVQSDSQYGYKRHYLRITSVTYLNVGTYSCYGEIDPEIYFEAEGVLLVTGEY